MLKRSWLEIDLNVLKHNYQICRSIIPKSSEIMAVVKADAYGHGANKVAECFQKAGCRFFAVSNIGEAVELRHSGINGDILILGYTPIEELPLLEEYNISQAIISDEYAEKLAGSDIKVHIAVDTGMNRIGLRADSKDCVAKISEFSKQLKVDGIFTHLCVADTPGEDDYTREQIEKFADVVNETRDMGIRYVHCMNSAGAIRFSNFGNLSRMGIILYGLKPDSGLSLPSGIKPAIKWESVVSMIKRVYPGDTIGYGKTFRVKNDMCIATIPTGYADGYNRLLSNKGYVLIHGEKAPIVGRICMDQFMVDISNIDGVQFEDEVELLGNDFNADDMAQQIGTIGYEVVCDIGKRVPRIYFNE